MAADDALLDVVALLVNGQSAAVAPTALFGNCFATDSAFRNARRVVLELRCAAVAVDPGALAWRLTAGSVALVLAVEKYRFDALAAPASTRGSTALRRLAEFPLALWLEGRPCPTLSNASIRRRVHGREFHN